MKLYLYILLLICSLNVSAQNLVQNGDFEILIDCPEAYQLYYNEIGWYRPTAGTSDYFNQCYGNNFDLGVPQNSFGTQNAYSGVGYSGFILFTFETNYREYLASRLLSTLKPNKTYCYSAHISLSDNFNQPISSFGVHFSNDSLVYTFDEVIPVFPQIENEPTNYIINTSDWTTINGSFVANGGEKYICIGNFLPDSLTKYPFLDPTRVMSYYYIDDVQLYECDSLNSIEEDQINKNIKIYPNPSNGDIVLEIKQPINNARIELYDAVGKLVYTARLTSNMSTLNLPTLNNGIYHVRLWNNNSIIKRDKLIIIK